MKLTAVDATNRLFFVESFLPNNLFEQLLTINWQTIPWSKGQQQQNWARRWLDTTTYSIINAVDQYIIDQRQTIEKVIGAQFNNSHPNTVWWYDDIGFQVDTHTDGHLPSSMQLFWSADSEEYGTTFYYDKGSRSQRHKFTFSPNTGYIMLNKLDINGSQPLQWHGMTTPVKKYRISSYTTFGPYEYE